MVESLREIAHFGGWVNKGVVLGDGGSRIQTWGDHMYRNVEITPQHSGTSTTPVVMRMPPIDRVPIGVEYTLFVYNTDSSIFEVVDIETDDAVAIMTIGPGGVEDRGGAATFMSDGTNWVRVSSRRVPNSANASNIVDVVQGAGVDPYFETDGVLPVNGDVLYLSGTFSGGPVMIPAIYPYYGWQVREAGVASASSFELTIYVLGIAITEGLAGATTSITPGDFVMINSGNQEEIETREYKRSDATWPLLSKTIELRRDMADMNAYDLAYEQGYRGENNFRFVIKMQNMTVGSSSALTPAFTTGTVGASGWGTDCSVRIEMTNSSITGWGGKGSDANGQVEVAPGNGFDCIHMYLPLAILGDLTSKITAGGGGGPNGHDIANCGGGGNGGNMTSTGAFLGSKGGLVLGTFGGAAPGLEGQDGERYSGGAGFLSGASWGGDVDATGGGTYSSTGGVAVNTESGSTLKMDVTFENGFTYGKYGAGWVVGSEVSDDIDFINANDPPSFARTGNSPPEIEVGSIIEITGTFSNGTWTPDFYEANLWEVTVWFGAPGTPNEQFEIKSYPAGDLLLVGEAGDGTDPTPGTLKFLDVTSSVRGPVTTRTL
jgi:hypothetical protein